VIRLRDWTIAQVPEQMWFDLSARFLRLTMGHLDAASAMLIGARAQ